MHRPLLIFVGVWSLCAGLFAGDARAQGDGRRAVKAERYGIATRVPQAWNLIDWSRDDKAFLLKLPQDKGSKSGYVSCELGVAPEHLEEFRARLETADQRARIQGNARRRLLDNQLEALAELKYPERLVEQLGSRLVTHWEIDGDNDIRIYETCARVIFDGTLYTFTLSSDEAHFEAYRHDFEEMLASCVFTAPETGLRRMGGGYWMQRDYRFALQLPPDWRPAFGPDDKALFFATGDTHELFTDNLLVVATRAKTPDVQKLVETRPAQITADDPRAEVTCRLVPQGATTALETVIHTRRGTLGLTILERRFSTPTRSYEVKFTCEREAFREHEAALRRTLETFVEVLDEPARSET